MPAVRSHPRSLTVFHPAPYALPPTSSLEPDMPLPLEPIQASSSAAAKPESPAPEDDEEFSLEQIRKAARRLAKKQGKVLVDEAEVAQTVMGRTRPGEAAGLKSVKGAQDWNRLLCWARKRRGPQWDACTQMYHVDYLSPEYYNPPAPLKALTTSRPPEVQMAPPPAVKSEVIHQTTAANRPSRRKNRDH